MTKPFAFQPLSGTPPDRMLDDETLGSEWNERLRAIMQLAPVPLIGDDFDGEYSRFLTHHDAVSNLNETQGNDRLLRILDLAMAISDGIDLMNSEEEHWLTSSNGDGDEVDEEVGVAVTGVTHDSEEEKDEERSDGETATVTVSPRGPVQKQA